MYRVFGYCVAAAIVAGTAMALMWVNEQMDIRYQAVGVVTDNDGNPMEGVAAILLLAPPSIGHELDVLFENEERGSAHGAEVEAERVTSPTFGLSGVSGAYIVRVTGRTGASRAIRLGLDTAGRPTFEVAWLVLRKEGFFDEIRTVSLLGWRMAPKGWGKFANRLPVISMMVEDGTAGGAE